MELNYDPWGRKRNPETWDYYTDYEHITGSNRSFGGHEQMDIMDMVNMDGLQHGINIVRMANGKTKKVVRR